MKSKYYLTESDICYQLFETDHEAAISIMVLLRRRIKLHTFEK